MYMYMRNESLYIYIYNICVFHMLLVVLFLTSSFIKLNYYHYINLCLVIT